MINEWVTLDIETISGSPDDAEQFIRNCYRPESFNTWSELTIGKRVKEACAKKKEKLSLLSAAPIICISLKTPESLLCFHSLAKCSGSENKHAIGAGDQKGMLVNLRNWLDEWTDPEETTLVGHNITSFDLPKLRWAFTRYGVRMPRILAGRIKSFDTMRAYAKHYAVGCSSMINLQAVLEEFQIESHKNMVSGADVQQLYEEGQHDTIVQYALLDVIAESELYLRMTGRSEALQ